MAKTDIGPKISVEGESEYRKQMKNIIQQQKEYTAELDVVTSSLGRNSTAQERAASVSAVLKKQIQAQESALAAQNRMLDAAKAKYGAGSTEVSAYQTAVNKSAAELAKLKNRLDDAKNGLGEFADAAKDTDLSGMTASVAKGQLLASAFQTIGKAALDAGTEVVKTGVAYNAQIEQYQVALTNMLGSEDQAVEVLNQIKEDAAKTPFDTAGLTKANQLLISAGVDAESSRQTILALGDAVSATGGGNEELSRMAQNLQQIKNAGKATSADIKQFAYAGIDVYGILADYTGKTTAEVQKMTVTYDLLTAALENASSEGGRYYGAMQTQSETLNGEWNTLKDNATQLAGVMTEDLTNGLKMMVENANDFVLAAQDAYDTGGWIGLADAITDCMGPISNLKAGFESFATSSISWLDQLSYKLNKALGKEAYSGYDTYEEYRKAADEQKKADERHKKALAEFNSGKYSQGKQYDRLHPKTTTGGDTGGGGGGGGGSTTPTQKKAAADQKKLAQSVTDTSTKMLEGTGNIVGAIKQVTETADNTYNVYDGTTGKLKETTTETAQTITKTWTEVVDGALKNFKQVDTLLDGVVQKTQITSDAVSQTQTSNQTSSQKIYGMEGVMGAVDRSTQITRETQKIWNEATGEFEDKIIESGKKVTDSFIRMNNGIKESVTVTKTYVGGQLTDTQEQVQALNDEIVDVQGTVGGFTKFILDLDTKLGGLETVANNLSNSPLGNWFSDLTKGYRADDSFWDNINLVSLAGSAVSGGISGYKLTKSPYGAAAGAIIGVIGNLLGTAISTNADTWGGDLVTSMAGGMEKAAPEIAAAASDIGKTISSFLHFSCPDVGPLTEYETWMPDMVEGMAEGIRKNTYKIRDAAADLSGQLQMQLQYDVGQTGTASQTTNNRTVRMGGVTVQVYAAPGQSAEEVADSVLERLQWKINQEAASIGEPLPVL
nr:MAG TPA: tail tape measure protein [Caudoviricetes sp.]